MVVLIFWTETMMEKDLNARNRLYHKMFWLYETSLLTDSSRFKSNKTIRFWSIGN